MTASITPIRTSAEEVIASALAARGRELPAMGRVGELRRAAASAFTAQGLPSRRVEEWKYTDLKALLRDAPAFVSGPASDAAEAEASLRALAIPETRRIVFADGALSRARSELVDLEPGLTVVPLPSALAGEHHLIDRLGALQPQGYDAPLAINTALMNEGLVVHVSAGAKITRPLHIAHVFTGDEPASTVTRVLCVVEDGAEFTLVESFEGRQGVASVTNAVLELFVGDRAHVDHVRIQEEADAATHLGTLLVDVGERAELHHFALGVGARVARFSLYGRFSGANAQAGLSGVNLLKGRQHGDVTLFVDHAVPGGESRELYKHVLADEARGVFQGKIVVRQDAQKTDGRMMSKALLLGDEAEMDNKPELEIFADDVQCGHGATVGGLDEDLLFYLRSRGVPAKEAEALLLTAFVGEAVESIENAHVREVVAERVEAWLSGRAGDAPAKG